MKTKIHVHTTILKQALQEGTQSNAIIIIFKLSENTYVCID